MKAALASLFVSLGVSACSFKPGRIADVDNDAAVVGDASTDGSRDASTDASPDAAPTCAGYTVVGSSKYRHVESQVTWINGETDCEADEPGATHLAIVGDELERTAIQTLVSVEVWIGLVDRKTEGAWVWVDGTPHTVTLPPWKAGEPSTGGNDDCAMMQTTGLYEAINCTDNKDYLCECDGLAAVPAAYTP